MLSKYNITKSKLSPGVRRKVDNSYISMVDNTLQFLHEEFGMNRLIGENPEFLKVLKRLIETAKIDAPVLVIGEVGTEKELFAQAIHYLSKRKNKPFLSVNCSTIPLNLFENELFGCEDSSQSDSQISQKGYIEKSNGGTLFLNEIDSVPDKIQSKLLLVLRKNRYKTIGGTRFRSADLRLIAASNINLLHLNTNGYFRKELLNQFKDSSLIIPPLRARKSDIPVFASYFVDKYSALYKFPRKKISKAATSKLMSYHWPGNIRELENVLHQSIRLSKTLVIEPENIIIQSDFDLQDMDEISYQEIKTNLIEKFERDYIARLLVDCNGDLKKAAQMSRMSRTSLYRMMKKYNIARKDLKDK